MTQTILLLSSMLTGVLFTRMSHPLAMGLMLLIQTLLMALITGLMSPTFWFSYVLFLVFLGGMLVLFIYVTSLASNEMFSISLATSGITMLSLLIICILAFINDLSVWPLSYPFDFNSFPSGSNYTEILPFLITKIYTSPTSLITLLLVIYLFLTLVAVVTITNIFSGPLRSKY